MPRRLTFVDPSGVTRASQDHDDGHLYDAVATQDTVTLIRSAIVIVLREAESALEADSCCCATIRTT